MKCIEPLLPRSSIATEPAVELGEGLGPKPVDPSLSLLLDLHQPGFPQNPQVPRDARLRER